MSFPNIPNITPLISVSVEQTIPLLLSSIALEELALAHIMNAEAEKLQFVLGTLGDTGVTLSPTEVSLGDLLDVNASVQRTLRDVIKKEMLLEFKFENVLDLLATLPEPLSCPDSVTLSDGSTITFLGVSPDGLTWNYQVSFPAPPIFYNLGLLFECALTSFSSCSTSDPFGFCLPSNIAGPICGLSQQSGIFFANFSFTPSSQTTFNFSFTLNQVLPIGTIQAFLLTAAGVECFEICGPLCS
ncbi:hypothetical protein [Neobacillus sp. YX16]|uniref:hypothetical protein n=1 Tax=Neobacillus sp. YX16 TaxID=3047874 RepID=UPI0032E4B79E